MRDYSSPRNARAWREAKSSESAAKMLLRLDLCLVIDEILSANLCCKFIGGSGIGADLTVVTLMVFNPDVVLPVRRKCDAPAFELSQYIANIGRIR